jgi:hypothetical protein
MKTNQIKWAYTVAPMFEPGTTTTGIDHNGHPWKLTNGNNDQLNAHFVTALIQNALLEVEMWRRWQWLTNQATPAADALRYALDIEAHGSMSEFISNALFLWADLKPLPRYTEPLKVWQFVHESLTQAAHRFAIAQPLQQLQPISLPPSWDEFLAR